MRITEVIEQLDSIIENSQEFLKSEIKDCGDYEDDNVWAKDIVAVNIAKAIIVGTCEKMGIDLDTNMSVDIEEHVRMIELYGK